MYACELGIIESSSFHTMTCFFWREELWLSHLPIIAHHIFWLPLPQVESESCLVHKVRLAGPAVNDPIRSGAYVLGSETYCIHGEHWWSTWVDYFPQFPSINSSTFQVLICLFILICIVFLLVVFYKILIKYKKILLDISHTGLLQNWFAVIFIYIFRYRIS